MLPGEVSSGNEFCQAFAGMAPSAKKAGRPQPVLTGLSAGENCAGGCSPE